MYWWQQENREQRTLRLITQLAVDLGRLPTFEEAAASDASLVHDAAYYFSSYDNLCELVAGRLYGSSMRTYPTQAVKLLGQKASHYDLEKLQRDYEARLKELGLQPKDPKRLTEPADLPEPVRRKAASSTVRSEPDEQLSQETLQEVATLVIEKVAEEVAGVTVNLMAQEVVKAIDLAEEQKTLTKEVRTVSRGAWASEEICIEALRVAYAEIGEKAFRRNDYAAFATKNGYPSFNTMWKRLGPQRDWRKYLEDALGQDGTAEVQQTVREESVQSSLEPEKLVETAKEGDEQPGNASEILEVGESKVLPEGAVEGELKPAEAKTAQSPEAVEAPQRPKELTREVVREFDVPEEPSSAVEVKPEKSDTAPSTENEGRVIDIVATGTVQLKMVIKGRPTSVVIRLGDE